MYLQSDDGKNQNGLESTPQRIGEDTADEGSDINPETIELLNKSELASLTSRRHDEPS